MTTVPHPTSTPASGSRLGAGTALPRAGRTGAAPLKNDNARLFQVVLFWAGAVMLPLGIVVIVLGWYGVANTPFGYDQTSYLMSGGFGGLAITFTGGFLYFGARLGQSGGGHRERSQAPGRPPAGAGRRDLARGVHQRPGGRRRRAAGHRG